MSNPCPHKTLDARLEIEQQAAYYFGEIRKFQPLDLDHLSRENWKDFMVWRAGVSPAGTGQPEPLVSVNEPRFTCEKCSSSVAESYRDRHACEAANLAQFGTEYDQKAVDVIHNLAMLVRRLCHRLYKHEPDAKMIDQALGYLRGEGLQGSVLRDSVKGEGETAKCGTAQTADISTNEAGRPTAETVSDSRELLSRPHRIVTAESAADLDKILNEPEPNVIVQSDGTCKPAPSPEELAREIVAEYVYWDRNGLKYEELLSRVAALLRPRLERAERPTLTRFDVYPWLEQSARKSGWNVGRFIQTIEEAGHLEELADTLLAFESRPLPSAPDTEKKA